MESSRRVSSIADIEMEKEKDDAQKANDRNALAEAKKLGKEAHAAFKARLAQERAATSEAKRLEKLRIIAEQKAEKARLAAESKAKRAEAKVCACSTNSDPYSISLFPSQINGKRRHKLSTGSPKVNSVPCLLLRRCLPRRQTKRTRSTQVSLKTSSSLTRTIPATS
jgi:hypothetical protein